MASESLTIWLWKNTTACLSALQWASTLLPLFKTPHRHLDDSVVYGDEHKYKTSEFRRKQPPIFLLYSLTVNFKPIWIIKEIRRNVREKLLKTSASNRKEACTAGTTISRHCLINHRFMKGDRNEKKIFRKVVNNKNDCQDICMTAINVRNVLKGLPELGFPDQHYNWGMKAGWKVKYL